MSRSSLGKKASEISRKLTSTGSHNGALTRKESVAVSQLLLTRTKTHNDVKASFKSRSNNFTDLFRYHTRNEKILGTITMLLSMCIGSLFPCFCVLFGQLLDGLSALVVDIAEQDPEQLITDVMKVDWRNLSEQATTNPLKVMSGVQGALGLLETLQIVTAGFDKLDQDVIRLAVILIIMGVIGGIAGVLQRVLLGYYIRPSMQRIRRLYLKSVLSQEIAFHDHHTGGELIAHATNDMSKIEGAIGDQLAFFFLLWGVTLSGLIIGLVTAWQIALVCIAFTPLIAGSGALMSRLVSKSVSQSSQEYASAAAMAEESLALIKTVTAFGGQKSEIQRFNDQVDSVQEKGIKRAYVYAFGTGLSLFVLFGSCSFIMWFAFDLVSNGTVGVGDAMTVFYAVVLAAIAMGQTFSSMEAIGQARGASFDLWQTIDRQSKIDALSDLGEVPSDIVGNIKFDDVCFAYPNSRKMVLNDFSVEMPAGQSIALVGFSGSGKSTTIQLLERFYDINSGSIRIDGRDVRTLNIQWMRGQIGYVGQEPVLFAGTIAENIAMGAALVPNPDFDQDYPHDVFHNRRFLTQEVTQNDIERACEMANAHDFICHMPDGYQTQIGEGGGMLSGGQKQRIAIARALIRDPKILLLDEATSALDVKSEAVVQAALDKASRGRTTIIIAHRLTTVRKANTIVFLDQGQILESGSHAELMAKGGEYADFVKLQEGDAPNKRKPSIISETSFTSLTDDTQTAITIVEATISREEERAALELVKNEDEIMLKKLNRTTKKTPEEKDAEKHFFKVIMIQRPEWWLLFVGFVCAIISGAMWPMFAFAFGEMLWVFITVDTERSMFYVWLFFLIGCIAFASNFFMHTANGYVAEKLTRRLREKTFRSLMRQDIGFFDQEEHSVGALSVNLSTDAANVSNLTGGVIIAQTMMFTTVLTSVAIGFASCAQLAAVMFATIPATGLAAYLGIRLSRTVEAKALLSMDNANTIAGEFLASVRTVTYLGVSENVLNRYNDKLKEPQRGLRKSSLISGLTFGFAQFIVLVVWGVGFWYGVQLVKDKFTCSVEGMITTFSALIFGGLGLSTAFAITPDVGAARQGATRIFRVIEKKSLIEPNQPGVYVSSFASRHDHGDDMGAKEVEALGPDEAVQSGLELSAVSLQHNKTAASKQEVELQGQVSFNELVFSYPSRPGQTILNGFTASIEAGKTLALVGESGCGKSSAMGILEMFYQPRGGHLSVDGVDVREYNLQSLRQAIGLVGQEPDLFTATVRENIVYGLDVDTHPVSDEEIIAACEKANAMSFIDQLEDGLSTHLGVRGSLLSGGQKQRVAIARALLRDPKILLLDEATSALDAESERVVQSALDAAAEGRTTIMIAHRLKTVENADKICVVELGKVVEEGTHSELMAVKGRYYNLVRLQTTE